MVIELEHEFISFYVIEEDELTPLFSIEDTKLCGWLCRWMISLGVVIFSFGQSVFASEGVRRRAQ